MDKAMDNDLICIPNDGKENLRKGDVHKFIEHCLIPLKPWVLRLFGHKVIC